MPAKKEVLITSTSARRILAHNSGEDVRFSPDAVTTFAKIIHEYIAMITRKAAIIASVVTKSKTILGTHVLAAFEVCPHGIHLVYNLKKPVEEDIAIPKATIKKIMKASAKIDRVSQEATVPMQFIAHSFAQKLANSADSIRELKRARTITEKDVLEALRSTGIKIYGLGK